jgi:hypothetical protein
LQQQGKHLSLRENVAMKFDVTGQVGKLEDIPNIGKSIAAICAIGMATTTVTRAGATGDLCEPRQMGKRLDPWYSNR